MCTPATVTCARALELELRRAVPSADWLAREHTKPSSATVRSVSPYAPVSSSWDWASRPAIDVRPLCQWNTRTRTRGRSGFTVTSPRTYATTLWRYHKRSQLCRRSLELPRDKDNAADRREADFLLGAQVPALTVRPTTRMSDHRFRGSRHGATNMHRAM